MRILFIGDSITKGEVGESFVDLFREKYPDWFIRNAGVNGDTLRNTSNRIAKELETEEDFDYIIIEVGYNDVILPFLDTKGLFFRFVLRYLYRKGKRPVSAEKFAVKYGQMIDFIQSKSKAKIILATLGCINENLSSDLNATKLFLMPLIQ